MATERITFDGDYAHLDEVVIEDALVHIERMSQHGWYIGIYKDGKGLQTWCQDLVLGDFSEFAQVVDTREPLLGCGVEWEGSDRRPHRCDFMKDADHPRSGRHICECGSYRAA